MLPGDKWEGTGIHDGPGEDARQPPAPRSRGPAGRGGGASAYRSRMPREVRRAMQAAGWSAAALEPVAAKPPPPPAKATGWCRCVQCFA